MSWESSYPSPPSYYKDFGIQMLYEVLIIESSSHTLAPPRPIEGEFWSNGFIRHRDVLKMRCAHYLDANH